MLIQGLCFFLVIQIVERMNNLSPASRELLYRLLRLCREKEQKFEPWFSELDGSFSVLPGFQLTFPPSHTFVLKSDTIKVKDD